MKYPKINTIYKRGDGGRIITELSRSEFAAVKDWYVTEKIDGTNIRVQFMFDCLKVEETVSFGGRTDDAQIPASLFSYLQKTFTVEKFRSVFGDKTSTGKDFECVIFGEGYGPKIQNGGLYRSDVSFIAFDTYINGWWLEPESVEALALSMGVDYVPKIGVLTAEEAVRYVATKPASKISSAMVAEGIVARSKPLLLFRDGTPLMWKLKVRDFGT